MKSSIIDVWQGSRYAFVLRYFWHAWIKWLVNVLTVRTPVRGANGSKAFFQNWVVIAILIFCLVLDNYNIYLKIEGAKFPRKFIFAHTWAKKCPKITFFCLICFKIMSHENVCKPSSAIKNPTSGKILVQCFFANIYRSHKLIQTIKK